MINKKNSACYKRFKYLIQVIHQDGEFSGILNLLKQ